jgi:hypothetical protein
MNRDQKALEVKKQWFGPWRMRGRSPEPAGRPYRLFVVDAGGARYTHFVTADTSEASGLVELKQRQRGVWMPVLQ